MGGLRFQQGCLWFHHQSARNFPSEDITEYINVVVKSNRFGRKTQIRVPKDITINTFIETVVDALSLPWKESIEELMVSFSFSYSVVYSGKKISLNQTLSDAQIVDGDTIELSITAICTDEIEKSERAEVELDVFYEMWGGRMQELEKRRAIRQLRGPITRGKIKTWADGFFKHIDEIGN